MIIVGPSDSIQEAINATAKGVPTVITIEPGIRNEAEALEILQLHQGKFEEQYVCEHEQLINNKQELCFCDECGGKICGICGRCFDVPEQS